MRVALERHDSILRSAIDGHDGYVFSTGGDGFAAAFARAGDGVSAAMSAQEALGVASAAVKLFDERARAVAPGFALDDPDDLAVVVEIC